VPTERYRADSASSSLARYVFAALEVAGAEFPAQRSKFSKRLFAQPQLVAILCLARHVGWSLRQAQAELARDRSLQAALSLQRVPHYSTLSRFRRRLDPDVLSRVCQRVERRLTPGSGADAEVSAN
jgi:hypothetical protein